MGYGQGRKGPSHRRATLESYFGDAGASLGTLVTTLSELHIF